MSGAPLEGLDVAALDAALAALDVDGWLLFDFHGLNPITRRLVGAEGLGLGTRRLFVMLRRSAPPVAVAHRIEAHALARFPGEVRPYATWRDLDAELSRLVRGQRIAMEVSPRDAVPYLDRVPHGVVELITSLGGEIVESAPLVTAFAARWTPDELAGHRRSATLLAEIAVEALAWAGAETARGAEVRETGLQRRVLDRLTRGGLVTSEPPIVAVQENSALPHYEPREGADRRVQAGQVLLLDLWARPREGGVFADQTWVAFTGRVPDAELRRVWEAVRGARDGVVGRLRERWASGPGGPRPPITGAELDDVARQIVSDAGFGPNFLHRTGHSIDRELHGSGPHLDNFETADRRELVVGTGFSVEPGVYLPGRFGMRSEINVFLGEGGPEVTPETPQRDLLLV